MKILLISLFLFSCAEAPVKAATCSQDDLSFQGLHTRLTATHGFTYHKFNQREKNIIVSLYNSAPPRENVKPDFVGFFMLDGKSEIFIVMVINDCIINYGKTSIAEMKNLLYGVAI
jgi:hypothetical protein